MLDLIALVLGLGLPWVFGIALVGALYRLTAPGDVPSRAWVAGCGWFVGMFGLTLFMRGLSLAGVRFDMATIAIPFAVATAGLLWLIARRTRVSIPGVVRDALRDFAARDLGGWRRALWLAMIGWLVLRFALLFGEVWWRPLYPWDAWTQWATKARVWFELRSMVPFVPVSEWLGAATPNVFYDAAPHYPATVPLFQVWSALLIGRWDDALVNLPWWMTGVAFGIALFGAFVRLGFAKLIALVGTSIVLSLPILNVHVALAGYADLPMACYLTLGTLAALQAVRTRTVADASVAVLLLAAAALVKNPGKAWLLVLLPGLAAAALPRRGLQLAGAAFAAAAIVLLVVTRTGVTILGYTLSAQFALPWGALFDAYFSFGNWNLLWYCAVATAVLASRQLLSREVAPLTCIVAAGLVFLLVGFAFSNAGAWVEDQSTVNRATLHLAPLVAVWMLVALRAWAVRHASAPAVAIQDRPANPQNETA